MPPAETGPTKYSLTVWWWDSDGILGSFTLICRHEDQARQWQTQFVRLIRECAERRAAERPHRRAGSSTDLDGSAFDSEEDDATLVGEEIGVENLE